jgi:hypothetical protein
MALETRPFPELKGKDAEEFLERVANFTIKESKEEVRASVERYKRMVERSKAKGYV